MYAAVTQFRSSTASIIAEPWEVIKGLESGNRISNNIDVNRLLLSKPAKKGRGLNVGVAYQFKQYFLLLS